MQPRQIRETLSPVLPRLTYSIASPEGAPVSQATVAGGDVCVLCINRRILRALGVRGMPDSHRTLYRQNGYHRWVEYASDYRRFRTCRTTYCCIADARRIEFAPDDSHSRTSAKTGWYGGSSRRLRRVGNSGWRLRRRVRRAGGLGVGQAWRTS